MSDDDLDRVGRAIRLLVPEPPRAVDGAEVRARVADRPAQHSTTGSRRWVTVGASVVAVAAVTVVAVLVSTFSGDHHSPTSTTAVSPGTSARSTMTSTPAHSVVPTPTAATPTAGSGRYIRHPGHWHSTILRTGDRGLDLTVPMVALDNDLYLIVGSQLQRISADSGRLLDEAEVAGTPRTVLARGGAVWVASVDGARLLLSEYTPTLRLVARTVLASSAGDVFAMAASRDGTEFFATNGTSLFRISRSPLRTTMIDTAITSPIVGLAVSSSVPATLYVATGTGFNDVVDAYAVKGARLTPVSGAAVGAVVNGNGGMAASSSGVWLATSTGQGSSAGLLTGDGRTFTSATSALADAQVQAIGDTAWITGSDELICADGSTGRPIAATETPGGAQVQAVAGDGKHAYAIGQPPNGRKLELIRIDLPAACSGS